MLSEKLIAKIKKYAKLRGGENYNEADPKKLIKAFENGTPEWQKVWEQGMDVYLRKIRTGKVQEGHSIGEDQRSN